MQFKVGDKVEWSSQANASWKSKIGTVVQVVPAKTFPKPLPKRYGGGDVRNHESYVVDIRPSERHKPNTYWPVASKLKPWNQEASK